MNKSMFIVLLISGILILIYITTPSGYDRELERQRQNEKLYSDSIKDIRVQFQKTIEHDRIISAKFEHDSLELVKAKNEAIRNYKMYLHEKNNKRTFTDHDTDSLLSAIR